MRSWKAATYTFGSCIYVFMYYTNNICIVYISIYRYLYMYICFQKIRSLISRAVRSYILVQLCQNQSICCRTRFLHTGFGSFLKFSTTACLSFARPFLNGSQFYTNFRFQGQGSQVVRHVGLIKVQSSYMHGFFIYNNVLLDCIC